MITGHAWRPFRSVPAPLAQVDMPCAFNGCGLPRSEHERSVARTGPAKAARS